MVCSNCGQDIPYEGKVCAYCGVDKATDKRRYERGKSFGILLLGACLVGGVLGGLIGAMINANGVCPGVLSGLVCAVIVVARIGQRKDSAASNDAVVFYCQVCGTRLEASRMAQGKKKTCPKCTTQIDIPTDAEMASRRRSNNDSEA